MFILKTHEKATKGHCVEPGKFKSICGKIRNYYCDSNCKGKYFAAEKIKVCDKTIHAENIFPKRCYAGWESKFDQHLF